MSKFGAKNALFEYFWLEFCKVIIIFEISTLEFFKYKFLIHTVSFGIRSTFSIGPGSAFYKRPGPTTDQMVIAKRLKILPKLLLL